MDNRGVRIKYGNFAPEAKENFFPSTNDSQFDTIHQLQQYNLKFPNFSNPCELYQTMLDGSATIIPETPKNYNLGLWSNQISDKDGLFKNPIVLEMVADGKYSSQSISLLFDSYNGIFANRINIKWYEDDVLKSDMDFYPDSAEYNCENQVEYYNKLIITFYSLNMPKNRLRVRSIDYGCGTWFESKNLKNVKIIQEINPISSEITINTADFTLVLDDDRDFLFQRRQPFSVYFNGELKSTNFVKDFKRKSRKIWELKTDDYIGIMDSTPYYGGIYNQKNAIEILDDIFKVAKVPYKIDVSFENSTVTGYIPYTTCRNALMQVAFAIQAVVDTSNSDCVNIFSLSNEITQTIPLERIMQGQNFDDEETVTAVEVNYHSYIQTLETYNIYNANDSGVGENIFIKFNQPLWDLSITEGSEILSFGYNYAIINARDGCVLSGKKYEHTTTTKRKNNPNVLANDPERVLSVENATLVSNNNVDKILDSCYNYFTSSRKINMKIVDGKHVIGGNIVRYGNLEYGNIKYMENTPTKIIYDQPTNVGDNILTETEFYGQIQGRIIKQSYNLNGGIIVKDCIIR